MKKALYPLVLWCFLFAASCFPQPEPEVYSLYEPVLMSRAQLETSVLVKAAQPISKTGKIYRYGDYLLINEPYKGVHLIYNQNPETPQPIAFLQVPGNLDFAVKQGVLYVDNAVDLVAIDIRDVNRIREINRVKNTFPALLPPDRATSDLLLAGAPKDAVIVAWEPRKQ